MVSLPLGAGNFERFAEMIKLMVKRDGSQTRRLLVPTVQFSEQQLLREGAGWVC